MKGSNQEPLETEQMNGPDKNQLEQDKKNETKQEPLDPEEMNGIDQEPLEYDKKNKPKQKPLDPEEMNGSDKESLDPEERIGANQEPLDPEEMTGPDHEPLKHYKKNEPKQNPLDLEEMNGPEIEPLETEQMNGPDQEPLEHNKKNKPKQKPFYIEEMNGPDKNQLEEDKKNETKQKPLDHEEINGPYQELLKHDKQNGLKHNPLDPEEMNRPYQEPLEHDKKNEPKQNPLEPEEMNGPDRESLDTEEMNGPDKESLDPEEMNGPDNELLENFKKKEPKQKPLDPEEINFPNQELLNPEEMNGSDKVLLEQNKMNEPKQKPDQVPLELDKKNEHNQEPLEHDINNEPDQNPPDHDKIADLLERYCFSSPNVATEITNTVRNVANYLQSNGSRAFIWRKPEIGPENNADASTDTVQHATDGPNATNDETDILTTINITQKQIYKRLQCSICLDEYKLGEESIKLICSHIFHEKCITHWIIMHGTCPICRRYFCRGELHLPRERVSLFRSILRRVYGIIFSPLIYFFPSLGYAQARRTPMYKLIRAERVTSPLEPTLNQSSQLIDDYIFCHVMFVLQKVSHEQHPAMSDPVAASMRRRFSRLHREANVNPTRGENPPLEGPVFQNPLDVFSTEYLGHY